MNGIKMQKMTQPTFSGNVLNFTLPDSWTFLTQEQLRYVLFALTHFNAIEAKVCIFVRLSGIKVLRHQADGWWCRTQTDKGETVDFFLHTWQIESFARRLDFVTEIPAAPVFLTKLDPFSAVDSLLRKVPFEDYLTMENCYQGYLCTHEDRYLTSITTLLYVNESGRHPHSDAVTNEYRLSSFLWYTAVKRQLMRYFPYLLKTAGEGEASEVPDMRAVMNAQIRALTGGDVTKEKEVLAMDCWRALTELNEKAREHQEFNQKYGRNQSV